MDDTNQSSSTPVLLLHHASAIRADPELAQTITTLVNEGYRNLPPETALRWDRSAIEDRLSTPTAIHDTIGPEGMFAVAYDARDQTTPLACGAARRWKHDLEGFSAAGEAGWEIITVTTRLGWTRRGLAGQCIDALVENLVGQAHEDGSDQALKIWVQAVECLNGAFWKNKGWTEVRSYEKPVGHWGSKLGYSLLVLLKNIEVE